MPRVAKAAPAIFLGQSPLRKVGKRKRAPVSLSDRLFPFPVRGGLPYSLSRLTSLLWRHSAHCGSAVPVEAGSHAGSPYLHYQNSFNVHNYTCSTTTTQKNGSVDRGLQTRFQQTQYTNTVHSTQTHKHGDAIAIVTSRRSIIRRANRGQAVPRVRTNEAVDQAGATFKLASSRSSVFLRKSWLRYFA